MASWEIQCKDLPEVLALSVTQLWHLSLLEGGPTPPGALMALIERGYPRKVVEAKLYKLADKGLIEYGVSIACPWLTPKGKERLKELLA